MDVRDPHGSSDQPATGRSASRGDAFTRRFVIGFAIVEALFLGWMLASGHVARRSRAPVADQRTSPLPSPTPAESLP